MINIILYGNLNNYLAKQEVEKIFKKVLEIKWPKSEICICRPSEVGGGFILSSYFIPDLNKKFIPSKYLEIKYTKQFFEVVQKIKEEISKDFLGNIYLIPVQQ